MAKLLEMSIARFILNFGWNFSENMEIYLLSVYCCKVQIQIVGEEVATLYCFSY